MTPYFYPAWAYGGIPRVVYELSRELVNRGHEVSVFTTDVLDQNRRCENSGKAAIVDGINVHYFRNISNYLAYHYQLYMPLGMPSAVQKRLHEFDIIHVHGHRNLLNNIIHYYAAKAGKRYILSGHGTVLRIERRILIKTLFDRSFGDRVLRDAGRFIAVSEHEVAQYATMGISENKVDVIYNGIDAHAFHNLPEPGSFRKKYNLVGKNVVLYLGKITQRKGIDFLVKAIARLDMANTRLVIAGNDLGFKNRVEEIIRDSGVGDSVLFTGLLTGSDKLSAYVDADILVYPATHEIFGLVPFEALMCGTPVIVADDCGCGEIIENQRIGYLVKYGDVVNLTETMRYVLEHRQEAKETVVKGQAFVREMLSWSVIGKSYETVYQRVGSGS